MTVYNSAVMAPVLESINTEVPPSLTGIFVAVLAVSGFADEARILLQSVDNTPGQDGYSKSLIVAPAFYLWGSWCWWERMMGAGIHVVVSQLDAEASSAALGLFSLPTLSVSFTAPNNNTLWCLFVLKSKNKRSLRLSCVQK